MQELLAKIGKSYEGYYVNNSHNPHGNPPQPSKTPTRNSHNPLCRLLETTRKEVLSFFSSCYIIDFVDISVCLGTSETTIKMSEKMRSSVTGMDELRQDIQEVYVDPTSKFIHGC